MGPRPSPVPPPFQPQPGQPPLPAAPATDDNLQVFLPTKNMQALLSYYFGVFGLIPFLGAPLAIAAIVLGIMGLHKFQQNPTPGAKGHALTGLILGAFELVVLIAFVTLVLIAAHNAS